MENKENYNELIGDNNNKKVGTNVTMEKVV